MPAVALGDDGVIAIDVGTGAVIVTVVLPEILPKVATTFTVPILPELVVKSPAELIDAEPVPLVTDQVTEEVKSAVALSE